MIIINRSQIFILLYKKQLQRNCKINKIRNGYFISSWPAIGGWEIRKKNFRKRVGISLPPSPKIFKKWPVLGHIVKKFTGSIPVNVILRTQNTSKNAFPLSHITQKGVPPARKIDPYPFVKHRFLLLRGSRANRHRFRPFLNWRAK